MFIPWLSLEARKLASSGHWTLPELHTLSGGGKSLHALVWQEESCLVLYIG